MQPGQREQVLPATSRVPGSRSTSAYVGSCGASVRDVHGCHSSAPKFAAHTSAAGSSTTTYVRGLAVVGLRRCPSAPSHSGAWSGRCLCQKPFVVGPVGVAVQVERPALEVGQRDGRDAGGVGEQLALGDRRVAGEEHLVEVGHLEPAPEHLPGALRGRSASSSSIASSGSGSGTSETSATSAGSVRAPQPVRVGEHLVVGPAAQHRARVVLGIPALHGVLVALVQQQPLARPPRRGVPSRRTSTSRPRSLLAADLGVQLAGRDRGAGVVGL